MKLHSLKTTKARRSRRIGRGGKRGTTAGRGTKGQHSRSGRRIRPAERDLIIRLPKLRGFRNKIKSDKPVVLNLTDLSTKLKSFVKGTEVLEIDIVLLKTAGLLGKNEKGQVKILSAGEIAFPVTLKNITASKSAQEKITKAGGKI
jgi:large subunit ribosomal protein L15